MLKGLVVRTSSNWSKIRTSLARVPSFGRRASSRCCSAGFSESRSVSCTGGILRASGRRDSNDAIVPRR